MYPSLFILFLFLERDSSLSTLNCKSPSSSCSGCTPSEGGDQSRKIVRINQTPVGLIERKKRDTVRRDSEGEASTHIYTSVKFTHLLFQTFLSHGPDLICLHRNKIHMKIISPASIHI